jgi:chorismate mutase
MTGLLQQPPAGKPNALIALVDAAAKRLQIAYPVAASKFTTGDPIDDPARERKVLDAVATEAAAKHIDPGYIKGVFRDQIDATSAIEHMLFARWKLDPTSTPVAAPDLHVWRGVIDVLSQAMIDQIALQWDSLISQNCLADINAAKKAVIGTRNLDTFYQEALDYVTRRYCSQVPPPLQQNTPF